MNGNFVIKLPSWTTTKDRSGMKITYIHESNEHRDEIIIPGLVTEGLKLVVWESFKIVRTNGGRTTHFTEKLTSSVRRNTY